jgi:23S rRNA G2069 N7-methylase RlmK/C1962 C5-methylase RlmI
MRLPARTARAAVAAASAAAGAAPTASRKSARGGGGDRGRPPPPSDAAKAGAAVLAAAAAAGAPLVVLKGGKSKLFDTARSLTPHPIIYPDAIDCVVASPPPPPGAAVLLADGDRTPFAWGAYNPDSLYRVRVLGDTAFSARLAPLDVRAALAARLADAVALRAALGLPSAETDVFRLVNSEGDRLSGLVVDALGTTLVVAACAAWVETHRADVEAALLAATPWATAIVWTRSAAVAAEEGFEGEAGEAVGDAAPAPHPPVLIKEGGLLYEAVPASQKTGFYADQRASRAFLRSLVRPGAAVLDLCCYSGGFALAAAAGGAGAVVGVDTSAPALALAERNAALNGFASVASFIKADAGAYAKEAAARGESFEIVVLDPPKLAPNARALPAALRKYASLNAAAMSTVKPGGLLMTCSCSGAVTRGEALPGAVAAAAAAAHVRATLVRAAGAAPDHTLDPGYPEGRYLTNLTYRITPE